MAIGDPPSNLSLLGIAQVPDMWSHITAEEMRAQLMRDVANAQAQVVHSFPPPLPPPPAPMANNATLAMRAREIFLKRMGGLRSEMVVSKEDFLQCHVYNEQVYVFYCFGGRHGVTLEGIDMFPSDTLITQFRLVLT